MAYVLTGWFLVNIVAPLALPVAGLLALSLLPLPVPPTGLRIMTTVKDGQLCSAVVAMGASSIYEIWTAFEGHKAIPPWGGIALAGVLLMMLPAMLVAAGGAVFSTPLRAGDAATTVFQVGWLKHYKVFVCSCFMTAITSFLYTCLHFAVA